MNPLIPLRLASHGLGSQTFSTPQDVVTHFGCLQAQDTHQADWVLASRLRHATKSTILDALRSGSVVRSWPMRGTLHYTDPQILPLLLSLCARKTLSGFAKRREFLGISESLATRALEIIASEMPGAVLTREDFTKMLRSGGVPMQTQWTYHLACRSASLGKIVFGPPTPEGDETFVLFDEWIHPEHEYSPQAGLVEIAKRYFRGHGGATIDDFAWWSGLGKTQCREAIEGLKDSLQALSFEGKTYYHFPQDFLPQEGGVRLIGGFDEYFLGYKNRSIVSSLQHQGLLYTTNGIFFPLILQDGQVVGVWKRVLKKAKIDFLITLLPEISLRVAEVQEECVRYAHFAGFQEFEIHFTSS